MYIALNRSFNPKCFARNIFDTFFRLYFHSMLDKWAYDWPPFLLHFHVA